MEYAAKFAAMASTMMAAATPHPCDDGLTCSVLTFDSLEGSRIVMMVSFPPQSRVAGFADFRS